MTFGVWVGVTPDVLRTAWEQWNQLQYAELTFDGLLANALPPWGDQVFGKPVHAIVHEVENLPWIIESSDPSLSRVLNRRWPHQFVLDALPA